MNTEIDSKIKATSRIRTTKKGRVDLQINGICDNNTAYIALSINDNKMLIGRVNELDRSFSITIKNVKEYIGYSDNVFVHSFDEGMNEISLLKIDVRYFEKPKRLENVDFSNYIVNKKGFFQKRNYIKNNVSNYLSLYKDIDEVIFNNMGYNCLITHGTLLGFIRDNNIIDNDDDFDCMFLSSKLNINDVTLDIISTLDCLKNTGNFSVKIGPSGHINVFDRQRNAKIDLMPAWFEASMLHIGSFTSIPSYNFDVYPYHTIPFNGYILKCIRNYEHFLKFQYGDNWRYHDPFYRSVRKNTYEIRNRKKLIEFSSLYNKK